jgi:hypothetical protein
MKASDPPIGAVRPSSSADEKKSAWRCAEQAFFMSRERRIAHVPRVRAME